jgi:hypothetical protein
MSRYHSASMLRIRPLPLLAAVALAAALGCASASQPSDTDGEATLTRGGGITGLSETIHIASSGGLATGTYRRSDRQEPRPLGLSATSLDSTLLTIHGLAEAAPRIPADTGRTVCADVILIHVDSRRGTFTRTAQEECPHRTTESERYWQRVDSVFRALAATAQ